MTYNVTLPMRFGQFQSYADLVMLCYEIGKSAIKPKTNIICNSLETDECEGQFCGNGVCEDGLKQFTCICFAGFTGTNCTSGLVVPHLTYVHKHLTF